MLPDLGRLALLHAHEEEEPTGVLAEWKRRREQTIECIILSKSDTD